MGHRTPRRWSRATAGLLAVQAGFQAALAMGAPWGAAAYGGGRAGTLPAGHRAVSAAAAVVYAEAGRRLLSTAPATPRRSRALAVLAALAGAMTVPNAASPSRLERALWSPWCVATAVAAWRARGEA